MFDECDDCGGECFGDYQDYLCSCKIERVSNVWVDINERKPTLVKNPSKRDNVYLVKTENGKQYVAWPSEDFSEWCYSSCCGCWIHGEVTHWKHLER